MVFWNRLTLENRGTTVSGNPRQKECCSFVLVLFRSLLEIIRFSRLLLNNGVFIYEIVFKKIGNSLLHIIFPEITGKLTLGLSLSYLGRVRDFLLILVYLYQLYTNYYDKFMDGGRAGRNT